MNLKHSDWDEDLPPDGREEYDDLIKHLQRNQGFGLYFVQCKPLEEEKIISAIIQDLPDKKIETLRLNEPIQGLYDQALNLYISQQVDILLIKGLEHSFHQYEMINFGKITKDKFTDLTKVPPILNHLNQQRERFRDNIPISIVFLMNQFSIDYFIRRAPDFSDWRSTLLKISATCRV
ncbi:hypothetical protein A0J48_014325 [Sphaerospermopsis aphanizomenoides BCCUSP55]|uniref:hypothetical protein n=1 Tax=Sphaerospermopsis aphanizomenoides TaxID=459663 RepID=UPI001905A32C|nr:hypothetical protein [Sphaerospermopsis aphanizomenoides]MBK1988700.1 hypothetical protein [Sphaerospermopsis aphanizomenoides BCCUSP55]